MKVLAITRHSWISN